MCFLKMCLLNTGAFQCICLLQEMNTCLIQVACLIEVATKTGFTVYSLMVI